MSRFRATIAAVPGDLSRDHVVRDVPPWRMRRTTECGDPIDGVAALITGQELAERITTFGQARAEFTVCPACWATAWCAPRWDTDPVAVLARETDSAGRGDSDDLRIELVAIAVLIEAHPDEFSDVVHAVGSTADLGVVRRRRSS